MTLREAYKYKKVYEKEKDSKPKKKKVFLNDKCK
jgi:hypothetical protein